MLKIIKGVQNFEKLGKQLQLQHTQTLDKKQSRFKFMKREIVSMVHKVHASVEWMGDEWDWGDPSTLLKH